MNLGQSIVKQIPNENTWQKHLVEMLCHFPPVNFEALFALGEGGGG